MQNYVSFAEHPNNVEDERAADEHHYNLDVRVMEATEHEDAQQ